MPRAFRLPESVLDRIIALVNARKRSVRSFASELGVHPNTLYYNLARRGDLRARLRRNRVSVPFVRPVRVADRAYLAGIIDGEGSISFIKSKGRWGVCVYSTSEPLMVWLCKLGGLSHLRRAATLARNARFGIRGNRDQFGWSVGRARDIEAVLRCVLPFLIVKRKRAEEALRATTLLRRNNRYI